MYAKTNGTFMKVTGKGGCLNSAERASRESDFVQALPHNDAVATNHAFADLLRFFTNMFDGFVEHDIHEMVVANEQSSDFSLCVQSDEQMFINILPQIRAVPLFTCHSF